MVIMDIMVAVAMAVTVTAGTMEDTEAMEAMVVDMAVAAAVATINRKKLQYSTNTTKRELDLVRSRFR